MITLSAIIGVLLAYLLGSVPTAVWLGKQFYDIDIREYGSGNAGATNTFRVLGKKAGIAVMIMDILKGFAATNIAYLFGGYEFGSEPYINYQLSLGITAVFGHIFPVFAGFRGGKGIATLFGMILAVHLPAAGVCVGVFMLVLIVSKYVSLGSISASLAFPLLIIFIFTNSPPSLILFSIAIALLVITTHQKNIERLLKGEESKTFLFGKKGR